MSREFVFPALITVLSLLFYQVIVGLVGQGRTKFNVPAPATTGHPAFERRLRVQANTLEQIIVFLPSLWLFSMMVSALWGAALGGVWILGRIVYAIGYFQAAEKRGVGFAITQVGTAGLLLGSLIGVGLQLMKIL